MKLEQRFKALDAAMDDNTFSNESPGKARANKEDDSFASSKEKRTLYLDCLDTDDEDPSSLDESDNQLPASITNDSPLTVTLKESGDSNFFSFEKPKEEVRVLSEDMISPHDSVSNIDNLNSTLIKDSDCNDLILPRLPDLPDLPTIPASSNASEDITLGNDNHMSQSCKFKISSEIFSATKNASNSTDLPHESSEPAEES